MLRTLKLFSAKLKTGSEDFNSGVNLQGASPPVLKKKKKIDLHCRLHPFFNLYLCKCSLVATIAAIANLKYDMQS